MKNLEKSDFYNLNDVERINALNASTKEIREKYRYSKPLLDEDVKQRNEEIHNALAENERISEEKKVLSAEMKENTKTINTNHKEIMAKSVMVTEKVWKIPNTETKFIEIINSEGLIVDQERMKTGSQMSIFAQNSAAV